MRSPTKFYKSLTRNLNKSKKLVAGVNPLECKTELQQLKLQSYILVTHAIIEEYLEAIVYEAGQEAKKALIDRNKICMALMALVATSVADKLPEKSKKKLSREVSNNLKVFITDAVNSLYYCTRDNHGITKKDQDNLLLRIGIDLENLDLPLSENLNYYGRTRGNIAHNFQIQREETLVDISEKLNQITLGLENLDKEICKLTKLSTQI